MGIVNFSIVPESSVGVFAGVPGGGLPAVLNYQSVGLGGMVTIVPAPGALGVLACAGLSGMRRRARRQAAAR